MISERYVTDEKGRRNSQCHGVPAWQWFVYARLAMTRLSQPEWRDENGVVRINNALKVHRCDDPDCMRLNRRLEHERPMPALYYLDRDIAPVRPAYETERDAMLCYGHPHLKGKFLCRNCAITGMTKRMIQEAKDNGTIHECREGERGGTRGQDAAGGLRPQGNDRHTQNADSHHARDC